tara:strand:+ start:78 stop:266 length:189 start_codon:yes stop_codon:yes gene_type:complete
MSATVFEPNAQVEDSSGKDRFEGFEPKMGDSTHTATLEDPHQEEQPWDAFLEEVEDREPSAN